MSRRDLGDAADLVERIGAFDPAQRAELVDLLDEFAEVVVTIQSSGSFNARSTISVARVKS